MRILELFSITLFILKVNGASVHYRSQGNSEIFSGDNVYSNGASIAVNQDNGKLEIYLDGKLINLDDAIVVSNDGNYKELSPVEVKGARVTINKQSGQINVDYKGAHYQSMTPDMVKAQLTHMMAGMQEQLRQMQNNLNNMFANTIFRPGFPFY